MSAFENCKELAAGAPVLSCFAAEAQFVPSYAVLVVLFAIIFYKLEFEPTRTRFAVSMFSVTIIAMLLTTLGFMPSQSWSILVVLSIFSASMLYWK